MPNVPIVVKLDAIEILEGVIQKLVAEAKDDRIEFTRDVHGQWRWRRFAKNGRIVGASSESYHRRVDCAANAMRLMAPPKGLKPGR